MLNFDYYYSNTAQNYYFSFNTLFSDTFQTLSVEAKALYALMLERSNLSNKNNWFDSENKVYIIFTAKHIMEYFQCSERTALKLLKELDEFGLIERHRTKIGQPYIIYVKLYHNINDTACDAQPNASEVPQKEADTPQLNELPQSEKRKTSELERPLYEDYSDKKEYLKALEQYWSDCNKLKKQITTSAPSELPAKNTADNCKICSCHLQNMQLSNINSSNTNSSIYYNPYLSYHYNSSNKQIDVIDEKKTNDTREVIKQNIDYNALIKTNGINIEELDNIVDIMTDVMTSNKPTLRIAGEERSTTVVKSVYSKLNLFHIQYVLECLSKNTTKINNIVAYTRTALYKAKQTLDLYYTNLVHHNMAYN